MEINRADVAELVDAKDLKSPGATEITHLSDLTLAGNLHEPGGDPAVLSNTPPLLRAGWQALENVGRRLFTDIDKPQERPMQITSVRHRKLVSLRGCEHKALEAERHRNFPALVFHDNMLVIDPLFGTTVPVGHIIKGE